ncbi:hypothetical protein RHMOL_Rhmol03G0027300 [Rhododendron molle]|uniref:Uncharacterized protein n=1 Tax=Rhododendron molle TaxID=49168 RepID=A0ACC0P9T4_RHOML|nr:hypothetical protein RHMOL_Rhmol03G0027300 [Rhododendron molle]
MVSRSFGTKISLLRPSILLPPMSMKRDFVGSSSSSSSSSSSKRTRFDFDDSELSFHPPPPVQGGTRSLMAIHVHGMVPVGPVISHLLSLYTYYSEEEPLFEVFEPQGNEGEGKWSSLPRPPFYRHYSYHESYDVNGAAMIVLHAVFDYHIFFINDKKDPVYAFNTRLPFREAVTLIFDHVWAAIDTSLCRVSPISIFILTADFGLVGRDVEGLENHYTHKPPLAYGIYYHLLDLGNGWVCLLKFGNDEEGFIEGKAYVSATVFRLVKKRTDKKPLHDIVGFRKEADGVTIDVALQ